MLVKPLEGEITSRYGLRNPTVPTVPKYHTGIDIAEVTGTVILAAMEGDVELVSSEGDLRKSCKNNKLSRMRPSTGQKCDIDRSMRQSPLLTIQSVCHAAYLIAEKHLHKYMFLQASRSRGLWFLNKE